MGDLEINDLLQVINKERTFKGQGRVKFGPEIDLQVGQGAGPVQGLDEKG